MCWLISKGLIQQFTTALCKVGQLIIRFYFQDWLVSSTPLSYLERHLDVSACKKCSIIPIYPWWHGYDIIRFNFQDFFVNHKIHYVTVSTGWVRLTVMSKWIFAVAKGGVFFSFVNSLTVVFMSRGMIYWTGAQSSSTLGSCHGSISRMDAASSESSSSLITSWSSVRR